MPSVTLPCRSTRDDTPIPFSLLQAREPRWGRNIETPGEDPYLTGEYAEYFTKGMQEAPEDPYHVQASACCKHYVGNSMESTTEEDGEFHDRNHVDSAISMQDLIDSYMPPFQSCVEKGRVTSLMCRCRRRRRRRRRRCAVAIPAHLRSSFCCKGDGII